MESSQKNLIEDICKQQRTSLNVPVFDTDSWGAWLYNSGAYVVEATTRTVVTNLSIKTMCERVLALTDEEIKCSYEAQRSLPILQEMCKKIATNNVTQSEADQKKLKQIHRRIGNCVSVASYLVQQQKTLDNMHRAINFIHYSGSITIPIHKQMVEKYIEECKEAIHQSGHIAQELLSKIKQDIRQNVGEHNMIARNKHIYSLFFGDKLLSVDSARCDQPLSIQTLFNEKTFKYLQQTCDIKTVIFLKQKHGVAGLVVDEAHRDTLSFSVEGDYLITKIPGIGLGILTADCLPVICVDEINKVIGIAHAGLRGSIAGVVPAMITAMKQKYGTIESTVKIIFGPSAKVCCYEIGNDIIDNLNIEKLDSKLLDVLQKRNGKIYFDLPLFNEKQLISLGVLSSAINHQQNACTICNIQYCSYRRDNNDSKRNITIVALR